MKKLAFIFCIAFLLPQSGAVAHQEMHVHSQWVKQELNQLRHSIAQLKAQIDRMKKGGVRSSSGMKLQETCGPNQQKLCSKSCSPGQKIENASCIGNGNIGKTYHSDGGVTCYCFNENDPNCQVKAVSATCVR